MDFGRPRRPIADLGKRWQTVRGHVVQTGNRRILPIQRLPNWLITVIVVIQRCSSFPRRCEAPPCHRNSEDEQRFRRLMVPIDLQFIEDPPGRR